MFVEKILTNFGAYIMMLGATLSRPEKIYMYRKELFRQMSEIGVGSSIITAIVSVFIGAVSAIQYAYQLTKSYVPNNFIGYMVRDSMLLEFAPNITCIVLAGKVGSSIASELGGMRQKEQIDALEIMGINATSFLVLPRILGGLVVIPMLVILSAVIGIVGGYIAVALSGIIASAEYMEGLFLYYTPYNVTMMLTKAFVYAFILTSVACFQGYYVRGGSIELGKASTQAVVMSDILIIVSDLLIVVLMT